MGYSSNYQLSCWCRVTANMSDKVILTSSFPICIFLIFTVFKVAADCYPVFYN